MAGWYEEGELTLEGGGFYACRLGHLTTVFDPSSLTTLSQCLLSSQKLSADCRWCYIQVVDTCLLMNLCNVARLDYHQRLHCTAVRAHMWYCRDHIDVTAVSGEVSLSLSRPWWPVRA